MRVCGNCKAEVDDKNWSQWGSRPQCPACHYYVRIDGSTYEHKRECPTCGAKNDPGALECPECGEVFS